MSDQSCSEPDTATPSIRDNLAIVMEAILQTRLSLGEVLAGIFTPEIFGERASPPYGALVGAFLRGEQPVHMATLLDLLLHHPDAQPSQNAHMFSLTIPYTKLLPARAVLTSWAAQTCADLAVPSDAFTAARYHAAKGSRSQAPFPPPLRPLPIAPMPEILRSPQSTLGSPTLLADDASDELPFKSRAPQGRILLVHLIDEERPIFVTVPPSEPLDCGGSANIWKAHIRLGNKKWNVALKVFRQTSMHHELVDREIRAWRRLRHPRLLRLLGTSHWDSQTVLVAPYMRNGNMLRYIQANPDNNPLGLVIQVAEGLRYLHDNAGIVHGDLKCQNILISGRGDAVLADFGLSTPTTKLESDATTCTTIRWQGTLQFSAPELLGSLSDDDRRQMRSKTVKTDIYAFGMLMLQAFTGTPPWGGIPDIEVIKHTISGQTPPNPGAVARSRGLDDILWLICLWCWQFTPAQRPPMNLIYLALTVMNNPKNRHGHEASLASMNEWLQSPGFSQHEWNWPVLNSLLSIIRTSDLLDILTTQSLANLLWAILRVEIHDASEIRAALRYFMALLRRNEHCCLRLLSGRRPGEQSPWTLLFSLLRHLAPVEVLDIGCIMGSVLLRLKQDLEGSAMQRVQGGEQWGVVAQSIAILLEPDLDHVVVAVTQMYEGDALLRCDESLQKLMQLTAQLSPARWSLVHPRICNVVAQLAMHRRERYMDTLGRLERPPESTTAAEITLLFDHMLSDFMVDTEP